MRPGWPGRAGDQAGGREDGWSGGAAGWGEADRRRIREITERMLQSHSVYEVWRLALEGRRILDRYRFGEAPRERC